MRTTTFNKKAIFTIDPSQIESLKHVAAAARRKRARICLHHSHRDVVQEMVIAICRGSYIRPHRHTGKSESFHVIHGELDVVFFDDCGYILQRVRMAKGTHFLYRLSKPLWHTVLPRSKVVVIHETTSGPFIRSKTEFAAWSPKDSDAKGIRDFFLWVKRDCRCKLTAYACSRKKN